MPLAPTPRRQAAHAYPWLLSSCRLFLCKSKRSFLNVPSPQRAIPPQTGIATRSSAPRAPMPAPADNHPTQRTDHGLYDPGAGAGAGGSLVRPLWFTTTSPASKSIGPTRLAVHQAPWHVESHICCRISLFNNKLSTYQQRYAQTSTNSIVINNIDDQAILSKIS